MSQPESESNIANSFRVLLDYVTTLGDHINQIYDQLEKIETDISKVKVDVDTSIAGNKKELENMKKTTVTKSDFNDILQKLNQPFEKFTPPKALEKTRKPRTSQTEPEKKKN
ncbi:MAG: hypothetical protein V1915_00135 [Candidatus Bathyarchaeota archaeon]